MAGPVFQRFNNMFVMNFGNVPFSAYSENGTERAMSLFPNILTETYLYRRIFGKQYVKGHRAVSEYSHENIPLPKNNRKTVHKGRGVCFRIFSRKYTFTEEYSETSIEKAQNLFPNILTETYLAEE